MSSLSMYFIAVVFKGNLGEEITALKEYMAKFYETRKALNSPPHITLVPPFKLDSNRETELIGSIRNLVIGTNEFEIKLDGFGAFKPRVIYIKPEASKDLSDLHEKLQLGMAEKYVEIKQDTRPYHPHITIGFRDLTVQNFHKAWSEFKTRSLLGKQICSSVALLKHNGKSWDIHQEIGFSAPDQWEG